MACKSAEEVFSALPMIVRRKEKQQREQAQLLLDAFCCFVLPATKKGIYKWSHFVENPSNDLLLIVHEDSRQRDIIIANGRFYDADVGGYRADVCAVSLAAACAEARALCEMKTVQLRWCAMLDVWTPSEKFQVAIVKRIVQQKFQLRQHVNELRAICKRERQQTRVLPLPHVFMGNTKNIVYVKKEDRWNLELDVCDVLRFAPSVIAKLPQHGSVMGVGLNRGKCTLPLRCFWELQPFQRQWYLYLERLQPLVTEILEQRETTQTNDGVWQFVLELEKRAEKQVEQRLRNMYADGEPPACMQALWEKALVHQRWDNTERYQLGFVINALGALQHRDMEQMYQDYAVLMRNNKFGDERIRHFLATNRSKIDYVRCARRRPGTPGIVCPLAGPEACLAGRQTKNGRVLYPDNVTIADVWTFSTAVANVAISGADASFSDPSEDSDDSINES
jgi:hypothetical protein